MEEKPITFTCPKCGDILRKTTRKEIEKHFKEKHKDVKVLRFGKDIKNL